ncbi:PREDICTED: xyloside xylosyltransferase 1 [Nicrophorus vespilloides]|uniref:Xyloside xylosyltransferase 1 n=1 Tax=Nicrophorus vespilloides TaxID=110193 RepID=A0ABM1M7U4_NICVS|nr:PREDICTED: xyloside xylosyltransferase 1 [Nicrophorus vespilloides]
MCRLRFLFNLSIVLTILVLLFYLFTIYDNDNSKSQLRLFKAENVEPMEKAIKLDNDYNLWLIFTKVIDKSPLMYNFNNLLNNLMNVSSVPLNFHIIVDEHSRILAQSEINKIINATSINVQYTFYDIQTLAASIQDIVNAMTPFFSSRPGTYYSDALFYLSLGLHRIAKTQNRAIILDCDLHFKEDVLLLFKEFDNFGNGTLFGLAPELSPVYRHILYSFKQKHNSTFGDFYHDKEVKAGEPHPKGFQGYNSGVILFNLSAIRKSEAYREIIKKESVSAMVEKFKFRGHLGDQDFYTLVGYERPEMIHTLNCGFNRQLCTWWRDRGGYNDIFNDYFKCKHKIVVLHGNCNTRILK